MCLCCGAAVDELVLMCCVNVLRCFVVSSCVVMMCRMEVDNNK